MPIMDGYAATKAIRALEKQLNLREDERSYIIALSGHCSEVYKERCYESGMDLFSKLFVDINILLVAKPIEFEELKAVMARLHIL